MNLKRLENGEIFFGSPRWTEEGTITCLVQLENTGEVVEFHATPNDSEEYGRELYDMLSGKYRSTVALV